MQSKVVKACTTKISLLFIVLFTGFASVNAAGNYAKPEKQPSNTQAKLLQAKSDKNNTKPNSNLDKVSETDIEYSLDILQKETKTLAHVFKLKDINFVTKNADITKSNSNLELLEELLLIKNAAETLKKSKIEAAHRYAQKVTAVIDYLIVLTKSKKCPALEKNADKITCLLTQIRKVLQSLIAKVEAGFEDIETSVEHIADEISDLDLTIQSRLDEIEDILEECCFSLESKIDNITVSSVCDLSGTFTVLNTIESSLETCCASLGSSLHTIDTRLEIVEIFAIENYLKSLTIISKLDECCNVLESKIDNLSISATCDLNGTFTVLNVIESSLDTCCMSLGASLDGLSGSVNAVSGAVSSVGSKLDTCCFSLESKLDNLTVQATINATCDLSGTFTVLNAIESILETCCFSLSSKADVITTDVTHGFFTVDSKLDVCCFSIESKLDLIPVDINSCCSKLDSDITTCCFTLNSKSDVIITDVTSGFFTVDSKIDACCFSLESKLDNLSISSSCDLSGTFTVLNTIETTLEQCCSSIDSMLQTINANVLTNGLAIANLSFQTNSISSKLDDCCFSLESKLDNLTVSASCNVTCDLSGTFTVLNAIESILETCCFSLSSKADVITTDVTHGFFTVDSKLDVCCFSIESKLDLIPVDINSCCSKLDSDITTCCFTLNSKSDVIITDVTSGFFTVDSKIDACCFSLESKLDNLSICATCDLSGTFTVLNTIESSIDACCFSLESKLDNLTVSSTCDLSGTFTVLNSIESSIDACCFSLESKLDMLVTSSITCAATPIYGPTTITTSGTYCLAQNIIQDPTFAVIEIAVSNVALNLNGHTVSNLASGGVGIQVDHNINNVVIENGIIQASMDALNTGTGIYLQSVGSGTGPTNVRLEKLSITGWYDGIDAFDFNGLVIEDISSSANKNYGLSISTSDNSASLEVRNSVFNQNSYGVNLAVAKGIRFENCLFDENTLFGASISECTCVEVANCTASGLPIVSNVCGSGRAGFFIELCTNVVLKENFACCYQYGYWIISSSATCLINNVAKGNCNDGFQVLGSTSPITLRGNTSNNNGVSGSGYGFDDQDPTGFNKYYNNSACSNGPSGTTNFTTNITSAPVTSPANANGADNIDCANTDADQIDVIESSIEACCFSLESKLDNLTVSSSCSITCDLSGTFTVLNTIESSIEACCFSLESKLDNLTVSSSCSITCDLSGTFTVLNTIESSIEACCFSLESKLDNLSICSTCDLSGTFTVLNTIESSIDACCFSLESKLDNLSISSTCDLSGTFTVLNTIESSIDACCFSLESKLDNLSISSSCDLSGTFTVLNAIESTIEQCCSTIESQLEILTTLTACTPTPIFGPTTITASGTYCLARDITSAAASSTGTIEIKQNNVVLDLNSHKVSNSSSSGNGIYVDSGFGNIIIKNGTIQSTAGSPTGYGIYLISNNDIRLEKLFISSWSNGIINNAGVSKLVIEDIISMSNTNDGLLIENSSAGVEVRNSLFNNNNSSGVEVDNSKGIRFENCHFDENNYGASVSSSTCIEFSNCIASGYPNCSGSSGNGFDISGSSVLLKDNFACCYGNGYHIFSSTSAPNNAVCLLNNVAKGNCFDGFYIQGTTAVTLRNNTADSNGTLGGFGFDDQSAFGSMNYYYNNTACGNNGPGNYNNLHNTFAAPVTSPANALGFDNVDCLSTDADQIDVIESKLDDCCFSLESKLDNLSVCATCDLSGTFTVLNNIESSIEACCFSLESKLDNLSICSTCDLSGTFTVLNTIESSIDACCFSLESKLDNLSISSSCDLSGTFTVLNTIESSIESCCFSLESKLDILTTTTITCAATPIYGPTTITTNGTYCLTHDVIQTDTSPAIEIMSNNVVLDLNGFMVTTSFIDGFGIQVDAGFSCIEIKNGTIKPIDDAVGTGTGINLQGVVLPGFDNFIAVSDVTLENLCIQNWDEGIAGQAVSELVIKNVSSTLNYSYGLDLEALFVPCRVCPTGQTTVAQPSFDINIVGSSFDNNTNPITGNSGAGALLNNCQNVTCEGCSFNQNLFDGCDVSNSSITNFIACNFNLNFADGCDVSNTGPASFNTCHFDQNSVNGVSASAGGLEITGCTALGAPPVARFNQCLCENSSGSGFDVTGPAVLKNNYACFYGTGFSINASVCCAGNRVIFVPPGNCPVVLIENIAEYNCGDGFYTDGNPTTFRNNTSNSNGGYGFDDQTPVGNVNEYYNNTACSNRSGNYINANNPFSAPVTSPAAARGFENVDCTNTDIPIDAQTLSKLDDCCFSLESKLDNLTVSASCDTSSIESKLDDCCFSIESKLDNFSISSGCDLSGTFTVLNNIESSIDACCFSLESKLDNLSVCASCDLSGTFTLLNAIESSLDACCFSLESKLDNLSICASCDLSGTFTVLNNIESSLDACCFSLESKLDLIPGDIATCCSMIDSDVLTIESKLDACCFSLESKLDLIPSDISSCCSMIDSDVLTVESKLDSCCFSLESKLDLIPGDIATCCSKLDSDVTTCCFTLSSKSDVIINDVTTGFFTVDSKIDACCFSIETKLDNLTPCAPTPITTQTNIGTAGYYCLANDLSIASGDAITISQSNVVLDLNNHTITITAANPSGNGISIGTSKTDIIIKNGTINGPGSATSTGSGILFVNPPGNINIILEKLIISDWSNGIDANDAKQIVIDNIIANANSIGFNINNSVVGEIRDSSFSRNGQGAAINNSCANINFSGCDFDSNTSLYGIQIQSSSCIELQDCRASGNASTGFEISDSTDLLIKSCFACANSAHGFQISSQGANTSVCFFNNTAKGNGNNGFDISGGVGINVDILVQGNSAFKNAVGFNDSASNGNRQYYSNVACGNSTNNYVGVTTAPITSPANALGADNIDCSKTDVDQIDYIESKLDDCCYSLNSKIDTCCFNLESKLDILIARP
jgi:hypothetical protein